MACLLGPLLGVVTLEPALESDLCTMAAGLNVAPAELVVRILEGRVKDWKHGAHAYERPGRPVRRPAVPAVVAHRVSQHAAELIETMTARSVRSFIRVWLARHGERSAAAIWTYINEQMPGHIHSRESLTAVLSQMVRAGAIVRVRPGVFTGVSQEG